MKFSTILATLVIATTLFIVSERPSNAASFWWLARDLTVISVSSGDTGVAIQVTWDGLVGAPWYNVDSSIPNIKEILAIALTAKSNGDKVNFQFNNGLVTGLRLSD